ncbi:MAG: hypothetical protein R2710_04715 [Acidimicrobiales bacterium]
MSRWQPADGSEAISAEEWHQGGDIIIEADDGDDAEVVAESEADAAEDETGDEAGDDAAGDAEAVAEASDTAAADEALPPSTRLPPPSKRRPTARWSTKRSPTTESTTKRANPAPASGVGRFAIAPNWCGSGSMTAAARWSEPEDAARGSAPTP